MKKYESGSAEEVFFEKLSKEERIAATCVVIKALKENSEKGGSFRFFLYTLLGLDYEAYVPVWEAGGQDITNDLDDAK